MPALVLVSLAAAAASSPCPRRYGCRSSTTTMRSFRGANLRSRASASAALALTLYGDETTEEEMKEQVEAVRSLGAGGWLEEQVMPLLTPVEDAWQPADLLPCPTGDGSDGGLSLSELRTRAAALPDELLVCLVGHMVTEEALPTYMSMFNRVEGARDDTGCSELAWARWLRGWTADENRHGDLLNRYLYLCGRVDMPQVERTVHHLLRGGMRMVAPSSPYHSFIYAAFQERATFISHARTAGHAARHGDRCLAKICGVISADEKRHEAAYTRMAARLFELDRDGMLRALAAVMRAKITMPGQRMSDGRRGDLFAHFSALERREGVYTATDYADMVEHFVGRWRVAELSVLSGGEGRRAQEFLCELPGKMRKIEERLLAQERAQNEPMFVPFSWVFDRPVRVA